jgi:hypothetical protein
VKQCLLKSCGSGKPGKWPGMWFFLVSLLPRWAFIIVAASGLELGLRYVLSDGLGPPADLVPDLLCFGCILTHPHRRPSAAECFHISPCSYAPVANMHKSKQRYRPLRLPHSGVVRDYNLIPRHLAASFVTAMANLAAPGDSLLHSRQAQVSQSSLISAEYPNGACRS